MSDDLIRRSDAIKAVNKAKAEGMTECPTYYLGIVQTIEPKRGEWIPYSERLPEENGRYLVTFPSLINKPWIDILWYGRPAFPETDHPCFYASDDEYGDVEYDDVVAWMPLPEPYGEREGER